MGLILLSRRNILSEEGSAACGPLGASAVDTPSTRHRLEWLLPSSLRHVPSGNPVSALATHVPGFAANLGKRCYCAAPHIMLKSRAYVCQSRRVHSVWLASWASRCPPVGSRSVLGMVHHNVGSGRWRRGRGNIRAPDVRDHSALDVRCSRHGEHLHPERASQCETTVWLAAWSLSTSTTARSSPN